MQSNLKLVLGFNRDQNVFRESGALERHPKYKNILCGTDKMTGTTWLALNVKTGALAFLTNYRTIRNYENFGEAKAGPYDTRIVHPNLY